MADEACDAPEGAGAGEESGRSKTTAKPRSGSLKSRGASSPSAGDEVESGSDASDEDYKFATSTLTKSTRLLQLQGAVGGGMGARTKGQYILRIYKCIDLADETQTVLRASLCTIFADVLDGSEGEADELLRAFERVAHRVVENLDERRREWGGGVDEQGCSGASSRIGASSSAAGAKIAPERNRQGRRDATTNATASAEEEPEMRFGVKFFKAKALKAIQKALGGGTAVRTKVNFVLNIYKTASAASEGLRPALLAALRVAFYPLVKKHGSGTELDEELLRGFEFTALHFVPDLDPRFLLDNQPPVTRSAGKVRGWARSASAVRVAKKRRRSPAAGGGGNDSGSDDESDRSGERDGGKKAAEPTYEDFRPADRVRFVDAAVDARRGEGAVISIGYNLTFLHVRLDKTGKSVSVPRGEVTKCAESLAVLRRKKDNLRVLDANGTTLEVGMAVTCVGLYVRADAFLPFQNLLDSRLTSPASPSLRPPSTPHLWALFTLLPRTALHPFLLARSQVPHPRSTRTQRRRATAERARLRCGAARGQRVLVQGGEDHATRQCRDPPGAERLRAGRGARRRRFALGGETRAAPSFRSGGGGGEA